MLDLLFRTQKDRVLGIYFIYISSCKKILNILNTTINNFYLNYVYICACFRVGRKSCKYSYVDQWQHT